MLDVQFNSLHTYCDIRLGLVACAPCARDGEPPRRSSFVPPSTRRLQTHVNLTQEASLDDFYTTATQNKAVAIGVKSLCIKFRNDLSSTGVLRKCLSLLANLEDLELHLSGLSRATWAHLLGSPKFQNLEILLTNAPHDILPRFLRDHPNLSHLTLSTSCDGQNDCPLAMSPLPLLTSVAAPTPCISAVVDGNPVERVVVTSNGITDALIFPSVVKALGSTTTAITSLHLEFDPMHRDVLASLFEIAPTLGALKLVEKQGATRVCVLTF